MLDLTCPYTQVNTMKARKAKRKHVVHEDSRVRGRGGGGDSVEEGGGGGGGEGILPTKPTYLLAHMITSLMAEWQSQHNEAEVNQLHRRVVEGDLEEEEEEEVEDEAAGRRNPRQGEEQERREKEEDEEETWKEDDIARSANEGKAILQAVLDQADGHYMTRRNDLARECFKSARRACKVVKAAPMPVNTPYNQCCFSGDTHFNRRIQFQYIDPVHRPLSPLYTVNAQWYRFLEAIVWISSYPTWVRQYVSHLRSHQRWNRRRDLYPDLAAIEQEEDTTNPMGKAFRQLQAALVVVTEMLQPHQRPSVVDRRSA